MWSAYPVIVEPPVCEASEESVGWSSCVQQEDSLRELSKCITDALLTEQVSISRDKS